MRWPARPNNQIVIQASNPRIPKAGGLCLAQTGDAGAGGVCFDAGLEGTGGRSARPPGSQAPPRSYGACSQGGVIPVERYYPVLMYAGPRSLPVLYIRRPLSIALVLRQLPRTPYRRSSQNSCSTSLDE